MIKKLKILVEGKREILKGMRNGGTIRGTKKRDCEEWRKTSETFNKEGRTFNGEGGNTIKITGYL